VLSPEAAGFLTSNPDVFLAKYFHHRLRHKLEPFHLALIDAATTRTKGLVLYPAAHGKTTIVSTLLPVWALCADPNVRIALIAKNDNDAKGIMQAIQAELLGNAELIRDFGPFQPESKEVPFGLERLSVAKRTLRAKEPTIAAFGSGSRNALGHRTDWVICDDIIHDRNSATPEQRYKIKEWFMQGPATSGEDADDRLTVVGTLFHPEDLYGDLMLLMDPEDGAPIWHVEHWDAIVDEEEHVTLWPNRWPWKRLMGKKAELGTIDFNKRYRNIAVDPTRMLFKEEHIRGGYIGKEKYPGCIDRHYNVGTFEPSWRRVAAIDPAVGVTRSAKFSAHLVLAQGACKDHERCYWVVDLNRDQMTLPRMVDLIICEHERYELLKSVIEVNSFQAGLEQAVQQKLSERGEAILIEPHHTTRTNKPDPELGVQALVPWFENGLVHIPWGNQESRRKMGQLVDELVQYPGRTTDTVMSFWMAWRALQQSAPRYKSFNRLQDPQPTWLGRRLSRRTVQNPIYAKPPEGAGVGFRDARH
jgi:predicted phage terminase large subunit-like protein